MKKPLKIPTPTSLSNVALHYLERYAASEASLRRVLMNRLYRVSSQNPEFAADLERKRVLKDEIEKIIERHKRTGVINDANFAEMKVNSLRRQGRSGRVIQQKLALKGIKKDLVAAALEQHADGEEQSEIEFRAALAMAKRRKLGTFRLKAADKDQERKDFATLARAGFSSDIVRRVLKVETPEEWEQES